MKEVIVFTNKNLMPHAKAWYADQLYDVIIGKGGTAPESEKREGDLKTPLGRYALKRVFYRPDRIPRPETVLPVMEITPDMGWCDDGADSAYNRLVSLPYAAAHEKMYRDDHLYDLVVEIAHNDSPPVPGAGSAIFLHLKRPDGAGTEGCIAFDYENLRHIVDTIDENAVIDIRETLGPVPARGIPA